MELSEYDNLIRKAVISLDAYSIDMRNFNARQLNVAQHTQELLLLLASEQQLRLQAMLAAWLHSNE